MLDPGENVKRSDVPLATTASRCFWCRTASRGLSLPSPARGVPVRLSVPGLAHREAHVHSTTGRLPIPRLPLFSDNLLSTSSISAGLASQASRPPPHGNETRGLRKHVTFHAFLHSPALTCSAGVQLLWMISTPADLSLPKCNIQDKASPACDDTDYITPRVAIATTMPPSCGKHAPGLKRDCIAVRHLRLSRGWLSAPAQAILEMPSPPHAKICFV
jgi:hypothetical protein